jgi:hypothetical protein
MNTVDHGTDTILTTTVDEMNVKVSKHVWKDKKEAVGKGTPEVAKLITSPRLQQVEECQAEFFLQVAKSISA